MENIQEEISQVILGVPGKGDRFTLRWGWFKFRLAIRPISTENLLKISGELANIRPVYKNEIMNVVFFENISDIRYFVNSIAIATGSPYQCIIRSAIRKLPLSDIQTLFTIVQKQCDVERFFFIYNSVKEMNLIRPPKVEQ